MLFSNTSSLFFLVLVLVLVFQSSVYHFSINIVVIMYLDSVVNLSTKSILILCLVQISQWSFPCLCIFSHFSILCEILYNNVFHLTTPFSLTAQYFRSFTLKLFIDSNSFTSTLHIFFLSMTFIIT